MPQQSSFTCTSFLTSALPHSHSPDIECVFDVQDSSARHGTSCEAGNWGGFISNCCEQLSMITYAPWGTGQLFLNSTEQTNCLISMKGIKDDVLSCGIDKITSGAGGCSDYTKDQARSACLRRWEEIVALTENEESSKLEADMCSFAVSVNSVDSMSWSSRNCSNITHCNMDLMRFSARKDASDDLLSEESGSLKISSKEIYSATDNLSADNFIDQGRAGKVYKGILSNGKHVAVKHIINDGSVETFICEVTSLPDVRHPNLVACEGVEEYFLVYELCQNGDLSGWLFGKDKSLPWITRLELAIDSAGGLWLLQTYPRGCIVLRDIKARSLKKGGDATEFADPKLNGEYSVEALDLAFNLALSCTGLKLQRPSMDQVVSKLEKALDTSTQKQSAFFTLPIKA
ncbi:hypothetical protein EV2_021776 [Malus domestica]